ncbi:hypothetical protein [Xanthomonas arboricola]|uniref:hypothetical protein n=1 Tax=Xanthomonas arboricola TaxID=56448 RepID=UPI0011B0501B|nr:hypothetical protein [Xanthomonas arboricola]
MTMATRHHIADVDPALVKALEDAGPDEGAVLLRIGAATSELLVGCQGRIEARLLQVGVQMLVDGCFNGTFPNAAALEVAIATVEDEIMKDWGLPALADHLLYADEALFEVVLASGFRAEAGRIELDLQAVEGLFGRLAAVSYGSTARQQGLPHDADFAARLLILREILHHMRFIGVALLR